MFNFIKTAKQSPEKLYHLMASPGFNPVSLMRDVENLSTCVLAIHVSSFMQYLLQVHRFIYSDKHSKLCDHNCNQV